jgi:hypothetical protein
MKNLESWARLAGAAYNAKDELARLVPRLDAAIAAADTGMLLDIRALAVRHATALTVALKHPAAPSPRRRATRCDGAPLWSSTAPGGRHGT